MLAVVLTKRVRVLGEQTVDLAYLITHGFKRSLIKVVARCRCHVVPDARGAIELGHSWLCLDVPLLGLIIHLYLILEVSEILGLANREQKNCEGADSGFKR